ncbi:twin-arginine translocase subunit TatC [Sphingomonas naphthae]|uniref:Sec-independent protein translocase protein TatC n=1 Tax=Sphingomonas naphthae TaxID=1813468 RepID=A0ABY7TUH1_9SPHN|nr:twin-arginine translocase subunit TatC [Sphingomonas naphthae]WCT75504.1 twin-arginine translocase subunit TatC [Sphingomonas naphthae]
MDSSRAPLLEHLIELRRRLLWSMGAVGVAFAVCLYFSRDILGFLVHPLVVAGQGKVVYTQIFEAFVVELKVAFFSALMIAFPVIANQIWKFVAPGLYKQEKRALLPFICATPILFLMGASLAYFVAIPLALHYLLSFSGNLGGLQQEALPAVGSYLSFVMQFLFGFGAAFLLPVLLMLLERGGIITGDQLRGFRRYAIVLNFAIAAVLSPPDVGSMMLMAVPLVILYEFALIGIRLTERKRAKIASDTSADAA